HGVRRLARGHPGRTAPGRGGDRPHRDPGVAGPADRPAGVHASPVLRGPRRLTAGPGLAPAGRPKASGGIPEPVQPDGARPGWGILPPGSTPRVILCAVAGAACAWIGAGLISGAEAPARATLLAVIVLAAARLLTTHKREAALAAGSALALAVGDLGGLASK